MTAVETTLRTLCHDAHSLHIKSLAMRNAKNMIQVHTLIWGFKLPLSSSNELFYNCEASRSAFLLSVKQKHCFRCNRLKLVGRVTIVKVLFLSVLFQVFFCKDNSKTCSHSNACEPA